MDQDALYRQGNSRNSQQGFLSIYTWRFAVQFRPKLCPRSFPAKTREEPVSGQLARPPLEELTFSLLSLSTTTQQKLLQHLAIRDLVYFTATCSELFDIPINSESWDTDNNGYFQSLPSEQSFRDTAAAAQCCVRCQWRSYLQSFRCRNTMSLLLHGRGSISDELSNYGSVLEF